MIKIKLVPGSGILRPLGVLAMPMECNIPVPKHEDWKLVRCPVCGQGCWESDLSRETQRLFPLTRVACTMCALQGKGGRFPERVEA